MKNNKGITLVSLIVTIIVMLILAGIALVFSVGEDGIINRAKTAVESYKEQEKIEKVLIDNHFNINANGEKYSEQNIKDMIQVEEKTNVSTKKLTTYYDKYYKKEFVVYRYDLTTEEERQKLEENGIKKLMGDVNLDGKLDNDDLEMLEQAGLLEVDLSETQIKIGDLNNDTKADGEDAFLLNLILQGMISFL